jgi:hypothetical protein
MSDAHSEAAAGTRQCNGHPTQRTLRRFVLGTTSPVENQAIVIHLLRRCDRCSQVVAEAFREPARTIVLPVYQSH